ncbi:class I SAM-dependent methyltransferase [Novosphingobium cyanobacteriorum]|uniref:Class I SAM-dependent methyltransferase n=1 Tax=Novosphingobium cyanobacteriorum TaxID=3024215 RepID=A0ABT6CJB6_9SPHN|nr:class I SAM-dependent methyltransferase [Novosphingobium cyanobacteriorum]MDF8333982.1 class I SAM-dependent methyltransferase [Novosphingobium cyanobacteriorum]
MIDNRETLVSCNCCASTGADHLFRAKGYDLVRCTGCGLAYIANPPTMEELKVLYSAGASYHAALCDPSSETFATQDRIAVRHLAETRRSVKSGRLLDVGCSIGQFAARAKATGFAATGLEMNEASAAFARSHFGIEVAEGTIHDAPQEAGTLDVLTMFDVIEHVPDPLGDLRKAWDLLAPGGHIVLSTPNIDGLFPRASLPLAKKLDYWPHPEPPYHLYQFSAKTLETMLEKAGFAVTSTRHFAIDLAYTFGQMQTLLKMPKRLAYAGLFAPLAAMGPWLGQGDWIYMTARKAT